jgi:hypothetical protein
MEAVVTAAGAGQRRGRSIAMSGEELDRFLAGERTCRVATNSTSGPHVAPLWFFWDGESIWLSSVVRSQRWRDLQRDGRVAIVIDAGDALDLDPAQLAVGIAAVVGEVPRVGEPVADLVGPESGFHRKYRDPGDEIPYDGKHAWLRVTPRKLTSWDFRKMARRGAEMEQQ